MTHNNAKTIVIFINIFLFLTNKAKLISVRLLDFISDIIFLDSNIYPFLPNRIVNIENIVIL